MSSVMSKLGNAQILSSNPRVASHIPETHPLTKKSIKLMIYKYQTVYIKPDNSCQGKGVIRVDCQKNSFQLKTRDKKTTYRLQTTEQVMAFINQEKMNRPYLIQRGIESYTVNRRLFDIRTHLLLINGRWQIGGIIGRVANHHGVATNAYSGGTPVNIFTLMQKHLQLDEHEKQKLLEQLSLLSLEATSTFSDAFPKWREFGLDIGVDSVGHLWIYEINIKPGMLVFRKDRESYERIMEMKKEIRLNL